MAEAVHSEQRHLRFFRQPLRHIISLHLAAAVEFLQRTRCLTRRLGMQYDHGGLSGRLRGGRHHRSRSLRQQFHGTLAQFSEFRQKGHGILVCVEGLPKIIPNLISYELVRRS